MQFYFSLNKISSYKNPAFFAKPENQTNTAFSSVLFVVYRASVRDSNHITINSVSEFWVFCLYFQTNEVKLWWPSGHGDQPFYRLTVKGFQDGFLSLSAESKVRGHCLSTLAFYSCNIWLTYLSRTVYNKWSTSNRSLSIQGFFELKFKLSPIWTITTKTENPFFLAIYLLMLFYTLKVK